VSEPSQQGDIAGVPPALSTIPACAFDSCRAAPVPGRDFASAAQGAPPPALPAEGRRGQRACQRAPDSLLQTSLRVFLDCQEAYAAATEIFRAEMGFVNWVRDRFGSDVHLLLTSLNAANGGREITVASWPEGYSTKIDTRW
jgi:hypothetical protein